MKTAEDILLKEMGAYHIEQKLFVINAMKEYVRQACEAQRLQDDKIAQQSVCDECRIKVHAILNTPLIELK